MTLSVNHRGFAERFFGFDVSWNDFGDDLPTLTLDPTKAWTVEPDGTHHATMASVLDRRLPLQIASNAWSV